MRDLPREKETMILRTKPKRQMKMRKMRMKMTNLRRLGIRRRKSRYPEREADPADQSLRGAALFHLPGLSPMERVWMRMGGERSSPSIHVKGASTMVGFASPSCGKARADNVTPANVAITSSRVAATWSIGEGQ
jgi:hypothetical protein